MEMERTFTRYFPKIIKESESLYQTFELGAKWQPYFSFSEHRNIYLTYIPDLNSPRSFFDELIMTIVVKALCDMKIESDYTSYQTGRIFLNLYRNGRDCHPTRSVANHNVLIFSLGTERETCIGKSLYDFESGDGIIFGKSNYRIPVDRSIKKGYMTLTVLL